MLFLELMSGGKCGKRRKFDFCWVGLQTFIVVCSLSHSNERRSCVLGYQTMFCKLKLWHMGALKYEIFKDYKRAFNVFLFIMCCHLCISGLKTERGIMKIKKTSWLQQTSSWNLKLSVNCTNLMLK
jgi:hypothetical protein